MPAEPYLLQLTMRLADGLAELPESVRALHIAYLLSAQNSDGGFSGREGGSDLYYTGFGLRGLAVLDVLTPEVCRRAAAFLRRSLTQQASVVDFFSLLYACALVQLGGEDVLAGSPADWPDRVAATLETFRTPDGGYAKVAGGTGGSVYHTFLVGLCYQLLGRPMPRMDEVARFIGSRHREDGGYVEIAPMRRSGTNPTAAAVGLLQMVEAEGGPGLDGETKESVVQFLADMASPEGGLRGNGRAPVADLLSTFTGIWTLHQLGALDRIDAAAALHYAQALEMAGGGFRGGLWDERADVEYTFYGLGCLALLTPGPRSPAGRG
ncbi:MAG TPA: prenyltransferase/squalene oxidase repeat-containing protein [Gemmataceae bacterium]|nr:prenyltransferase/squalene oxidase repeat-containing protein [Gemmataceae bacterium]